MRRKLVYISALFVAMLMILSCSAYATNVLLISEEETVSGTDVATMMGQIVPEEFNVTEVSIDKGKSLEQTINAFDATGKGFDSVIIQLSYEDAVTNGSATDFISAISTLYTKVKKDTGTKVFIGTPVGKISNYETEISLSQGAVDAIIKGLTSFSASSIPVYENTGTATSKSLVVCADNKLTALGNLLVACTYCNSLEKPVVGLTSYDKLADADVKEIVSISKVETTSDKDILVQDTTTDEKLEDTNDQIEIYDKDIVGVNREPIMDMSGSDSKELVIQIYDKEGTGLKTVSLTINDANGAKIEQEKEETDDKKCTFKIDREKYLDAKEFKQFYIYAEDKDGCILREFFKVKYVEKAENGSYYKINRAPRVRPRVYSEARETKVNKISLYVMDQTGVQRVTPRTVEENGIKAVNLYADGRYDGYDGIEGNYDWQDIKSKTTTGLNIYIKEAHTKEQDAAEFFKHEKTTEKVSLSLAEEQYRFNAHAVDATGLASDRIMIVDFSEKEEDLSDKTTDEDADNPVSTKTSENKTTSKNTETSKEEKGTMQDRNGSHSGFEYRAFKADREPRLKYVTKSDYLYIEIRDCAGVACEFPSGEGNKKREANKSLQPQIYYYKNDKRGSVVPNLKRPTEQEYKKENKEYVYTIGLPVSEIGEEYTKFEILARDVQSDTKLKTQTYIDEIFMVKKTSTGEIIVNRAPVVHIVGLMANFKQMAAHAIDWTGVSKVEIRSLPKSAGQQSDTIRSWNGAVQSDWTSVAYCTKNKKYAADALSKFEKIDTVFSKSSWIGLNPKTEGEDGVYQVEVAAIDASGAKSSKKIVLDVTRWVRGEEWGETGNATKKSSSASSKNVANSSSKSGSSSGSASSSSKNSQSKKSSAKNSGSSGSGSSGSGSSGGSGKSGSSSGSDSSGRNNTDVFYGKPDSDEDKKETKSDKNNTDKHEQAPETKTTKKSSESTKESKGSSKKNAIENHSKFKIGFFHSYEKNAYMMIGNAMDTSFTIYSSGGKIDSFDVDGGEAASSSIYGSYMNLRVSPNHEKVYKSNDVYDAFATITAYSYNEKDKKWYKDSCRLHCIMATDRWWNDKNNRVNLKVNLK